MISAFRLFGQRLPLSADRREIRILQLTDVHYDNSNDRKEDTIALLKYVIETRMPILSP